MYCYLWHSLPIFMRRNRRPRDAWLPVSYMLAHISTFYIHELTVGFSRLVSWRGLSADRLSWSMLMACSVYLYISYACRLLTTLVACSLAHARDFETAVFFHTLTDLSWRGLSFGMHFFPEAPKIRQTRTHCKTQGMFNVNCIFARAARQPATLFADAGLQHEGFLESM